jgi:hypothetical protein
MTRKLSGIFVPCQWKGFILFRSGKSVNADSSLVLSLKEKRKLVHCNQDNVCVLIKNGCGNIRNVVLCIMATFSVTG